MLFKRRLHRNVLAYVNNERLKQNLDPIRDLPLGFRNDDERGPIARALGRPVMANPGDEFADVMFAIATPCEEACELWEVLFDLGFYSRYEEARLYEGTRRRPGIRKQSREVVGDARERYYRLQAVLKSL
jgi:hypothetical protein